MIPATPIDVPAAWRGARLRYSDTWLYHLSPDEIAELEAIVSALGAGISQQQMLALTPEDFPFDEMKQAIRQWSDALQYGLGFLQIKGWPAARHTEIENALVYWGIGLHLGQPVSQNTDGDLLGHVRDTGADPDDPSVRLYKTRVRQDFHADGADIIGLMCLQPSKSGGESKLASSVTIFNEVLRRRPDLAPLMFEDFYFDHHGQQAPGQKPYWRMPICSWTEGGLRTWFADWYIRQAQRHPDVPRLTEAQDELIDLIVSIANDPDVHLDIHFEVGDMQFLKNSVILHARNAYEDHDNPALKRHLLRLWLARRDFADGDEGLRGGIRTRSAGTDTTVT